MIKIWSFSTIPWIKQAGAWVKRALQSSVRCSMSRICEMCTRFIFEFLYSLFNLIFKIYKFRNQQPAEGGIGLDTTQIPQIRVIGNVSYCMVITVNIVIFFREADKNVWIPLHIMTNFPCKSWYVTPLDSWEYFRSTPLLLILRWMIVPLPLQQSCSMWHKMLHSFDYRQRGGKWGGGIFSFYRNFWRLTDNCYRELCF